MCPTLEHKAVIDRTCDAFKRRLVELALKAVTQIEGMYDDTDAGRALLEAYNARPLYEAYEIIREQRLFPFCVSCDHPIVDGKPHGGYCAEEREANLYCSSRNQVLTLPELFTAARCISDDCHHLSVKGASLCDCCQAGMVYKCTSEGCHYLVAGENLKYCLRCSLTLAAAPGTDANCIEYNEAAGDAIGWMICKHKGCYHVIDPDAPDKQGYCMCCG